MGYVIESDGKFFKWADAYMLFRLVTDLNEADEMSLPLAHVALTKIVKSGRKANIVPIEDLKARETK
jgi:CRISPR/Cas system-associated protein Cas5 (RAMP superfamily)